MDKERLLTGILKLPTIEVGTVAEDDQIIEGNQGRVHYKMTREIIPFAGGLTILVLSVSGPTQERLSFIEQITAELGEPLHTFHTEEFPETPGIHFAGWEARSVEKKLRK